jgi:uncharacterized protein YbcC (UPF0753/DUF2309 family)
MNQLLETQIARPATRSLPCAAALAEALRRIPPLWPLKNFVAVNPFLGLADQPFTQAAQIIRRVAHDDMLMPADYYLEALAQARLTEADLAEARTLLPDDRLDNLRSLAELATALRVPPADLLDSWKLSFANFLDRHLGTDWSRAVTEEISKWCSAYYDQGQSAWRMPWRGQGLFAAWRSAAALDANPELLGLKQFRSHLAALPADHREIISLALAEIGVPDTVWADYLHRQLMSMSGWSGHVQYLVRQKSMAGQPDDSLAELLAIRLVFELALFRQFDIEPDLKALWQTRLFRARPSVQKPARDLAIRALAQTALECAYQRQLARQLKPLPANEPKPGWPALQAVFCIDVRSEVFRRALEAQSPEIETIGFAGFFGLPIEYVRFGHTEGAALCPVLLRPAKIIREGLRGASPVHEAEQHRQWHARQNASQAWNSFKTSAISCFSFVESAGWWFGLKLAQDALGLSRAETGFATGSGPGRKAPVRQREESRQGHATGLAAPEQIELAAGALKNMGLTDRFARLVLICGHGSATYNNPYGPALDCGACGGHAGDANARLAADLLNAPEVRAGLAQRGIHIPDDTRFVAGLHNTTTDEVVLYDLHEWPAERATEADQLRRWLASAGKQARNERSAALGLSGASPENQEAEILHRSRDWSQVRPEWGLAGNAAFIAAPRARTRHLNLGGRTFLHNYDVQLDPDRSILELIMVAPMVVASWINLQYYGSTVNNRLFGSGNKVLHNVVGTLGVWEGNGGDLRPGLPEQSVHDGQKLAHEPLRLSVFLEAPPQDISAVLGRQPEVRQLVENGWIHLFALEPGGPQCWRYQPGGEWVAA